MLNVLTNTIMNIAKNNNTDSIDDRLDCHLMDLVVEFLQSNSEFYVPQEIGFGDFGRNLMGCYVPREEQVFVNIKLAMGMARGIRCGNNRILRQFISTMLHEHRHAWQYHTKQSMIYVDYEDGENDYEAYYNHPMEVDARMASDKYLDKAMEYINNKLKALL